MKRLALCFLGLSLAAAAQPTLWLPLPPLPAGNAGMGAAQLGGHLIIAGGTDVTSGSRRAVDRVLALEAGSDSWRLLARLPRPYFYGAFGSDARQLVLVGGDDDVHTRSDVWSVDSEGHTTHLNTLPQPIGYTGGVVEGGGLYVLGGARDIRHLNRLTADFFRLDLRTAAQTVLPPFPSGPMFQPCLAAAPSRIYSFAGGIFDHVRNTPEAIRSAWVYDIASRRWSSIAPFPFPVRALTACTLDPGHILLAGGAIAPVPPSQSTASKLCFCYDIAADRYLPLPDLPYGAMLVGLIRTGDSITLIGGEDAPHHRAAGVFEAKIAALLVAAGR